MPHVDGMCLRAGWTERGQSRFARPVAKVTAFALALGDHVRAALAKLRPDGGGRPRRARVTTCKCACSRSTMRTLPTSAISSAWSVTGIGATAAACATGNSASARRRRFS